jgi:hypothetical protein
VQRLDPIGLLDVLPESIVQRAYGWERHVVEVETGLPPDAAPGTRPRELYNPARRALAQRDAAKAAELSAAGQRVSGVTVKRMRLRYRSAGVWGLVDHRCTRGASRFGRADPRVVAAMATLMQVDTNASTGTRSRLRRRLEQHLAAEHGQGTVALPSRATFYRLAAELDTGRHTFGAATTRRTQANRPARPFTPTVALRPGELVQIGTGRSAPPCCGRRAPRAGSAARSAC